MVAVSSVDVEAAPQRYKSGSSSPTGLESPPRPWSVSRQHWGPSPATPYTGEKAAVVYPAVEDDNRLYECFLPYLNEYLPYLKVLSIIGLYFLIAKMLITVTLKM
jgi:hypothetical protein